MTIDIGNIIEITVLLNLAWSTRIQLREKTKPYTWLELLKGRY